ncbi:hypothetical protein HY837_01130 [archaeon]|nr:hypothetical protein [archaeon]
MINTSDEDNFDVLTSHFNTRLSYLGHLNSKNLTIIGDVNNWTGSEMEKGLIIVKGDVNDSTGNHMMGGKIKIIGNITGGGTGHLSSGGEIYVTGNMEDDLSYPNRGKARIYHQGELVWPKEKY